MRNLLNLGSLKQNKTKTDEQVSNFSKLSLIIWKIFLAALLVFIILDIRLGIFFSEVVLWVFRVIWGVI